jgi:hypothetical protein
MGSTRPAWKSWRRPGSELPAANRIRLREADPSANMSTEVNNRNERQMIRVITFSSGFGLGVMAAVLVSIKQVTPNLKFGFSFRTLLAFALAIAFSWFFWRMVFPPGESSTPGFSPPRARKRRAVQFAIVSAILCLATMTAFGLSLKGVGNERIREVIQGAAIAVLALISLGFVLWRIARFLENDSRNASQKKQPP